MTDFEKARDRYTAARTEARDRRTELVRAREELKRHRRDATDVVRRAARVEEEPPGEVAAARRRVKAAEERVQGLRERLAASEGRLREALDRLAPLADPTEAAGRLSGDVPIALFPLRLETRFRRAEDGGEPRELLVRAYPDDVLVDTFQPEISDAERANTATFWTHWWRAGGREEERRAAWSALARSHGAGRARWLTERVSPAARDDEPSAEDDEHVLVVRTTEAVPPAERSAIARFWERVWSTGGRERDEAFSDLAAEVGRERAGEVERDLAPVNLRDPAVKPDGSLTPVVAYLQLPAPSELPLSRDDWTRGARARLLPERLVLLGYREGEEVLRQVGRPIPPDLAVGPDPSAPDDDQLRSDGAGVSVPEALRWTTDFPEAVERGMAFRVDLEAAGVEPVFDRLFVLGVRVGSEGETAAGEVEELIRRHQASRKGFSLLPQGRPTNNTDASRSGYSWWEDHGASYDHFFGPDGDEAEAGDWRRRPDGAWLAGMLGIDREVLRASPHDRGTDQAEARAMNTALWPATLGYYMEQMMEPVFSEETVRSTRDFFTRFVVGRGTVPAVRVGRQPYGVLPTTSWSRIGWWKDPDYAGTAEALGLPSPGYLGRVHRLLERATEVWSSLARDAAHVGDPGPDPHQTLLDLLGLHPTSAEFHQRYAQSFAQHLNTLSFGEGDGGEAVARAQRYVEAALLALSELGWRPAEKDGLPELLEKIFLGRTTALRGGLVEPGAEDGAPLGVARDDGLNYVAWLREAAGTSHDALRRQEGFTGGPPSALLYLMLRHALDLGFVDAGLDLRRRERDWDEATYRTRRKEPAFIDVAEEAGGRSRWEMLYRPAPGITGDPDLRLGDHIPDLVTRRSLYLGDQLRALEVLEDASVGSLERALVEHVDALHYRLDAWHAALQSAHLSYLRRESEEGFGRRGLHAGVYGWVENLAPSEEAPEAVSLDAEQAGLFEDETAPPLRRDPSNLGHIHAPSLDQAVTAAVLRSGHVGTATPEEPDLLAVDLDSERTRLALQVIEGVRNGQPLGALLGYRLERDLHDETDLFLDRIVHELRRAFPLAGNRMESTRVEDLEDVDAVEARNVVDGAAFAEHLAETGADRYPYDLTELPPLSELTGPGLPDADEIGRVVDGHVERMRSIGDAVGDLAVSEGVYQVVRGNWERAAGALDAASKGTHGPLPELPATPRGGRTLLHRVALHLPGGRGPGDVGHASPRARGEPSLALWLEDQLPDPADVFARVAWTEPESGTEQSLTPSMEDLGLHAVDLFYLLGAGGERGMPGFDDLLLGHAAEQGTPRPPDDALFSLEYRPDGISGLTLFEVAPLARSLRGAIAGARPLRPTDMALQGEASSEEDLALLARDDGVRAVLIDLQDLIPDVEGFRDRVDAATGEDVAPGAARDAARDGIDAWLDEYLALVRRASPFGTRAAGVGTALEGRRERLRTIRELVADSIRRLEERRAEHDEVMARYGELPTDATEEERTELLVRAGRIVSTDVIAPLPPPPVLETRVAELRGEVDDALSALRPLRRDASRVGAALSAVEGLAPTLATMDRSPPDPGSLRDGVHTLARELVDAAAALADDLSQRSSRAAALLASADAAVGRDAHEDLEEAARALLGEDFTVLPEFSLSDKRLGEWDNAWSARDGLLDHLRSGSSAPAFPVDDWLHGVARVREPLRHLERAILLGEALDTRAHPRLEALQFPYRPDDAWLAMRFPDTAPDGGPFEVTEDRLLYTAHFAPGASIDASDAGRTYAGLLLDEWTEVVPGEEETTGLAFHFDRPNAEAPQAILLATPPVPRSAWRWEDLTETLHETLDMARLRSVEPDQLDSTALAPLVPAVISAVTTFPITAMLNFAFNNDLHVTLAEAEHE